MTSIYRQVSLYDAIAAFPSAPCGAPASRIAVPSLTASTQLFGERSATGLADSQHRDICHDPAPFFSYVNEIVKRIVPFERNLTRTIGWVPGRHAECGSPAARGQALRTPAARFRP